MKPKYKLGQKVKFLVFDTMPGNFYDESRFAYSQHTGTIDIITEKVTIYEGEEIRHIEYSIADPNINAYEKHIYRNETEKEKIIQEEKENWEHSKKIFFEHKSRYD